MQKIQFNPEWQLQPPMLRPANALTAMNQDTATLVDGLRQTNSQWWHNTIQVAVGQATCVKKYDANKFDDHIEAIHLWL